MLYETDDRIKQNESQKNNAIANADGIYNQIQSNNSAMLDKNNEYLDTYLGTNNDLADRQTNFNVDLINQQKQEANKTYQKQSREIGMNYQKATNPYGVEAEKMADSGLGNSGYVEKVNLDRYSQTQKQISEARANLVKTSQELDNKISEARLSNDSTKATFALDVMKQKLEAELEQFQYSSELKLNKLETNQGLENDYYTRYTDIVNQINYEKEQEEAKRQYAEQLAYQKSQDKVSNSLAEKYYQMAKKY